MDGLSGREAPRTRYATSITTATRKDMQKPWSALEARHLKTRPRCCRQYQRDTQMVYYCANRTLLMPVPQGILDRRPTLRLAVAISYANRYAK